MPPPTFCRTFVLRKLPSDSIFSSRAHVFHDILCCWRRNRSPAPAPLVFEFDVGDDGAVDALGVRSGGNVLGELQNSDSRVDASDFDTDISSRLICTTHILIRTCSIACLMLGLPRCTHAPLHSREHACLGGDSKFYNELKDRSKKSPAEYPVPPDE